MDELQPYQILQELSLSQPNKIHFYCKNSNCDKGHKYYTIDNMERLITWLTIQLPTPLCIKIISKNETLIQVNLMSSGGSCMLWFDFLFANTDQANLFEGYEYRVGGEKYLEAKESLERL